MGNVKANVFPLASKFPLPPPHRNPTNHLCHPKYPPDPIARGGGIVARYQLPRGSRVYRERPFVQNTIRRPVVPEYAYAAAEIGERIRWSKALSEAFAPSPTAMTICL